MERLSLEQYLQQLIGAEGSFPFGPDALVFKVMGKMFALVGESKRPEDEGVLAVSLKCDPVDAQMLVSQFDAVIPGYHLNKKHWITLSLNQDVEDSMVKELIDASYQLVVSKLTKRERLQLRELI
ncbi:MmcQ/YjbR family DNA-binding protein [Aliivibrio kagoshimensis]|uniref:MmcQ/YjbR family DNA-binding protein n=1 Tax=Aliivibrio kagoshimensis TaxID=2910230 RepID=UPI003D1043FE